MVTLDDYRPVAITIVPITMQPAVMLIEFGAWAAIVIAVPMVIPVRLRCGSQNPQRSLL